MYVCIIHTYTHTNIHTYIHTCIHTYMDTYKHTNKQEQTAKAEEELDKWFKKLAHGIPPRTMTLVTQGRKVKVRTHSLSTSRDTATNYHRHPGPQNQGQVISVYTCIKVKGVHVYKGQGCTRV
jgi:predicted ATPase